MPVQIHLSRNFRGKKVPPAEIVYASAFYVLPSVRTLPENERKAFPAWALAARVAFAISPNSACCERVFALLKSMYGDQQMSVLADLIQAALMLRYNGRRVG